jgi:4,5-dihydroxyphthalate decarboxylase
MKLHLTFACWDYDRTRALADGTVRPEGIDLTYLNLPVEETFFRMMRGQEFDASEMSLSSYTACFRRASSATRASSSIRRAASASPRT